MLNYICETFANGRFEVGRVHPIKPGRHKLVYGTASLPYCRWFAWKRFGVAVRHRHLDNFPLCRWTNQFQHVIPQEGLLVGKGVLLNALLDSFPLSSIESLNGKIRDELLSMHRFTTIFEARRRTDEWKIDYNEVRPHSGLGYQAPKELAKASKIIPRSQLAAA
jgi:Integrase core domain